MSPSDILIIGAGPSGLFAAAELARHGVAARLIEREPQPHREPRATSIQPGTLEILESAGALAPFLAASEQVHCPGSMGCPAWPNWGPPATTASIAAADSNAACPSTKRSGSWKPI